jgi:outer membrane protein with beta-barrel domain
MTRGFRVTVARMSPRPLALAVLLSWAAPARAVDQGEWQLGAGAGFALLREGNNPTSGLGGRIEGRYGLRDGSAAWAAVASSWHPRAAETVRASAVSAGFSLAYDVLRIIPFAEVGPTVAGLRGAVTRGQYLGMEGALGAEYLLDRRWSAAAVARYQYLFVRLGGTADMSPGVASFGLRLSRTF